MLFELLATTLKSVHGREVNNQVLHGICPQKFEATVTILATGTTIWKPGLMMLVAGRFLNDARGC